MFRRKWLIISRFLRNILPPLALRRLIPVANFHDSTWRLSSIPDVFKGISNTTYTYDATNQLTHDGTTTYSYDLNGNRTMPGYTTGGGNRLSSDGTWTYSYDDEGNLTGKTKGAGLETWAYTYDHENHLKSVRQTSNGTTDVLRVTYSYDSLGQRVQEDKWKTGVGSATARFVYDGDDVWADLDGTNTLQTRYLRGDNVDEVFARIKSTGAAGWYLTDRLGSVRDVTDASGTVVDHLDYSGFGVVTESNASAGDRYKWTGREYDGDTGLQYNRARYFDGGVGRWTSEDPLGFAAGDSNLGRYVANIPTGGTDPSGLQGPSRYYPGAPFPPQMKRWEDDEARAVLEKQIKEWKDNGWQFPASVLQYFLDKKGGKHYEATQAEIAEVAKFSQGMIRIILAGQMDSRYGINGFPDAKVGDQIVWRGKVRWVQEESAKKFLGEITAYDASYTAPSDFMFYAYAGARVTIYSRIKRIYSTSFGSKIFVFETAVHIEDGYDFPFHLGRQMWSLEYSAAHHLDKISQYPSNFFTNVYFFSTYSIKKEVIRK